MPLKINRKLFLYDSSRTGESRAARRQASTYNESQSSNSCDMLMQYAGLVYGRTSANEDYGIVLPTKARVGSGRNEFFTRDTTSVGFRNSKDAKREYRVPFESYEINQENENLYDFSFQVDLNTFIDFERFKSLYLLRKSNPSNFRGRDELGSWWLDLPQNKKISTTRYSVNETEISGRRDDTDPSSRTELASIDNSLPDLNVELGNLLYDQQELERAYINFLNFLSGDFEQFSTPALFRAAPTPKQAFGPLQTTESGSIDVSSNLLQQVYADHATSLSAPLSDKEVDASNPSVKPFVFDAHPEYNYFIEGYESRSGVAFNTSLYKESQLPNYYIIENIQNNNVQELLEDYGYLSGLLYQNMQIQGSFFENYSEQLLKNQDENPNPILQEQLQGYGAAQEVVFIDADFGKTIGKNKQFYPFYNNIKLTTFENSKIVENIDEKINSRFVKGLNASFGNSSLTNRVSFLVRDVANQVALSGEPTTIGANRSVSVQNTVVDVLSTDDFFELIQDNDGQRRFDSRIFSFDTDELESAGIFELMARIGSIRTKVNEFIQNNKRTLFDVLTGVEAKSEIICFSIEKTNKTTGTVEQEYFVINDIKKIINYVDTQVKYLKNYTYNLNAFILIAGAGYTYQNLEIDSLTKLKNERFEDENRSPIVNIKGKIATRESNQIVKLRIASVDSFISDSPPVSPNVDFYFNPNDPRSIRMFLTPTGGEILEEAKPIFSNDLLYFANVLYSQNKKRDIENNLIKFKTDDFPLLYEILKIDFEPSSYQDFASGQRRLASTSIGSKRSDSTVFEEKVELNKPFYYCFRAIDVHGGTSNPSQVFKVINTYSEGALVPIVEEYDFKNNFMEPSRKFRRFIKIQPSIQQIYLSNNQFAQTNNIEDATSFSLGLNEKSVFGKKFRAKITSKKTGKKIFIDFDFDLNKNKLFTYIRNQNQNTGGNN